VSSFAARADLLAGLLAEKELDLLVVTNLVNVRYLTGFTGTNGIVVVGADLRVFGTDFRYFERVKPQLTDYELRRAVADILEVPAKIVEESGSNGGTPRVGFDDAHLSVRAHGRLAKLLDGNAELVPAGGLVEGLRAVKDADEIARMRQAAALAADVYDWLVAEHGLVGHTERSVATALERRGIDLGAEAVAFPPIVAAADNGALPHAEPRQVEIPRDTLVVVDLGFRVDGYCSDCTRTYATGSLDDEASSVYGLVQEAQAGALAGTRAGVGRRELDGVARKIISDAGRGDEFGHGLGHGVGLEVHEEPTLTVRAEGELIAGNAVTIEPGVYVPGRFGVRIEDLVVVTADGSEILTPTSKELTVV
jgi:Xaa-Pro aminopeptidase